MRELIQDTAKVLNALYSLNLLKESDITTTIVHDEYTKKYILNITLIVPEDFLYFCLDLFLSLKKNGHIMSVEENNRTNPAQSILSINFYEK